MVRVADFGAFVEMEGFSKWGLVHVTQLQVLPFPRSAAQRHHPSETAASAAPQDVPRGGARVETKDVVDEGDAVWVKVHSPPPPPPPSYSSPYHSPYCTQGAFPGSETLGAVPPGAVVARQRMGKSNAGRSMPPCPVWCACRSVRSTVPPERCRSA